MTRGKWTAALFYAAAGYDGILGVAFVFLTPAVFDAFKVTRPNHLGYTQFAGLLLLVFASMFVAIARNPLRRRNLIPYGIMLKASFCLVVFGHWVVHGVPGMWKPLAFIDAVLGMLFLWAYAGLRHDAVREGSETLPAGTP